MNHQLLSAFLAEDDDDNNEEELPRSTSESTHEDNVAAEGRPVAGSPPAMMEAVLVDGNVDKTKVPSQPSTTSDDSPNVETRSSNTPPASSSSSSSSPPPPFLTNHSLFSVRGVGPSFDEGPHDDPHDEGRDRDNDEAERRIGVVPPQEKLEECDDVKRRKLLKMVASGYPSFHLLLSANYDNSDDETPQNDNVPVRPRNSGDEGASLPMMTATTSSSSSLPLQLPPSRLPPRRRPIYIDLDEELGLKPKKRRSDRQSSTRRSSNNRNKDVQLSRSRSGPHSTATATTVLSAADQGYYEGVVDVALPEDEYHLSELHCWTRRQLEYFSASELDARTLQPGRRTPLVPGRVGIRCKHCWRSAVGATTSTSTTSFPADPTSSSLLAPTMTTTGAVSYPNSFGGIYAACAQKPTLHFEQHCPGLPPDERQRLQVLMAHHHQSSSSSRGGGGGGGPGRRAAAAASARGGDDSGFGGASIGVVPTTTYYVISAKRLGIVEASGSGGDGLRFSRDLALDPLPLETMLRLEEASASGALAAAAAAAAPTIADGSLAVGGSNAPSSAHSAASSVGEVTEEVSPVVVPSAAQPLQPRIAADEESEQVLAEAVMEPDDPARYPGRVHDKAKVTDFFFLTLRQMAITNAIPMDFAGKGKKTKLMRVGFAGFCCRHCYDPNVLGGGGCRSFSSAADNLSSSISNSFVAHLQKCHHVPVRIKRALAAYKRLHQRQLAQIPYGSQRRLIHDLWARLRACDVPEEEMNERVKAAEPPPSIEAPDAPPTAVGNSVPLSRGRPTVRFSPLDIPQCRPESFPECNDEETQEVLKRATDEWDPDENDGLMLPSERYLISDYLFLTMRQLKVAFADHSSVGRRSGAGTAGLQCMHCMNKDNRMQMGMPSGKTFPSAPDNFASSMNTSLYGHMQACAFVPPDVKSALCHVRKIHSIQCSNLKFGSQRRFFNILFDRLRATSRSDSCAVAANGQDRDVAYPGKEGMGRQDSSSRVPSPSICAKLGFAELSRTSNQHQRLWVCAACRMVPVALRSCGSFFTETCRDMEDRMTDHRAVCASDSFHLGLLAGLLEDFFRDEQPQLSRRTVLQSDSFRAFVSACVVGDVKLLPVFLDDVAQLVSPTCDEESGSSNRETNDLMRRTKGLWASFPAQVDSERVLKQFQCFALTHDMSPDLASHPSLLKFALVIAPGLVLPLLQPTRPAADMIEIESCD